MSSIARIQTLIFITAQLTLAPGRLYAAESDFLSKKIIWKTPDGKFAAPIHVSLMPNGKLVFNGFSHLTEVPTSNELGLDTPYDFEMTPTPLGQEPTQVMTSPMNMPMEFVRQTISPELYITDASFCSGHTLTSEGNLFLAGGTRAYLNPKNGEYHITGLDYGMMYNGTRWTRVATSMKGTGGFLNGKNAPNLAARWYPTATRLHDSRLLITSGFDYVLPVTTSAKPQH